MFKQLLRTLFLGSGLLTLGWPSGLLAIFVPASLEVAGDQIKLGEIFQELPQEALAYQDTIVINAPALGQKMVLSPQQLQAISRRYRLGWMVPFNQKPLEIIRKAYLVSQEEIIENVRAFLPGKGQRKISLHNRGKIYIPENQEFEIEGFEEKDKDRFTVKLTYRTSSGSKEEIPISGTFQEMIHVPTLRQAVKPGTVITESFIEWKEVPRHQASADILTDPQDIIGKAPKRYLTSHVPLRSTDLKLPMVVQKGNVVSVSVHSPHMRLVLKAKALENGAIGDTISFQGYDKTRTILAKITSPSTAIIE